jgi:Leucine-rich repeat (LRR) protein
MDTIPHVLRVNILRYNTLEECKKIRLMNKNTYESYKDLMKYEIDIKDINNVSKMVVGANITIVVSKITEILCITDDFKYNCSILYKSYNSIEKRYVKINYNLYKSALLMCKHCSSVDIKYIGITSISSDINQLKLLCSIDLSHNKLTNILLDGLPRLSKLNLSHNNIDKVSLKGLSSLKILNLSHNKLDTILLDESPILVLETLILSNNRFTEIPQNICCLKYLKILNMSSNSITKITNDIGNLKSLMYLLLQYNQLMIIPTEMKNLKYLHYVNLSNNNFQSFPQNIITLSLFTLVISNNQIKSIPNIHPLYFLRSIDITNNPVENISE